MHAGFIGVHHDEPTLYWAVQAHLVRIGPIFGDTGS